MLDSISRQAAIDVIERLDIPEDMCVSEILSHIELAILTLPSAQPERKTGRWIETKNDLYDYFICSECCTGVTDGFEFRFCPNCGAKME